MKESEVVTAALKLPARKREKLAEAILSSIKTPSKRHVEALWVHESERRVDALLAGKIKTVPADTVLAYRAKR